MHVVRRAVSFFLPLAGALLLASCGGSSTTQSETPPKATFTWTATEGDLTVSFNSTGSISADGNAATSTWTFGDQVTASTTATTGTSVTHTYWQPGTYNVTLTVTDDHGTSVEVSHTIYVSGIPGTELGVEEWSWIGGSQYADNAGTWETEFLPDTRNLPSARQLAATWYSGGKFWMFGGAGYDSTGATGDMNDLWSCTPGVTSGTNPVTNVTYNNATTCVWTWVGGSNKVNTAGTYSSAAGTFSATALPGARSAGAAFTDLNGNMWLFGGAGLDVNGNNGVLNDMWSFSQTGQAEWVSGPNVVDDPGAAANPPSRAYGASWTDKDGNFWIFGGESITNGSTYYLNDMWCYTPNYGNGHVPCGSEATSSTTGASPGTRITSGTWTQITAGVNNGSGVYGTQGVAASTNLPGARISPQTWVDGSGNLWLFGGSGYDSVGTDSTLSDVWMFNPKTKVWTYMYGSGTAGAAEVTGTQGTYASGNTPSARLGTIGWTDSDGVTLWLFGGSGSDSTGTSTSSDGGGSLNELWAFNTQTLQWAWVAGFNVEGYAGAYPVPPQGVPSIYAIPGSRLWSNIWVDSSNTVWIFGGTGDDVVGSSGYLNDLWTVTTPLLPNP